METVVIDNQGGSPIQAFDIDIVTHPTRITCATDGVFLFQAFVGGDIANGTGQPSESMVFFRVNGSSSPRTYGERLVQLPQAGTGNYEYGTTPTAIIPLSAGDYVELVVYSTHTTPTTFGYTGGMPRTGCVITATRISK